mmetsp:Transcript_76878/g.220795  ORF Transcript_76878/g.220795 Transcript_76878/m.220795 type:complete len:232 (-) Transcript_76878:299-994(-)
MHCSSDSTTSSAAAASVSAVLTLPSRAWCLVAWSASSLSRRGPRRANSASRVAAYGVDPPNSFSEPSGHSKQSFPRPCISPLSRADDSAVASFKSGAVCSVHDISMNGMKSTGHKNRRPRIRLGILEPACMFDSLIPSVLVVMRQSALQYASISWTTDCFTFSRSTTASLTKLAVATASSIESHPATRATAASKRAFFSSFDISASFKPVMNSGKSARILLWISEAGVLRS